MWERGEREGESERGCERGKEGGREGERDGGRRKGERKREKIQMQMNSYSVIYTRSACDIQVCTCMYITVSTNTARKEDGFQGVDGILLTPSSCAGEGSSGSG